ncbi:unnamed protein product [Laminaria digitata]
MEVEFYPGGRFDSGAAAASGVGSASEYGVERYLTTPRLPRKGAVGLGLERLIEAVLERLEGAGTGQSCDETSCAALRLLHVVSAADDSQRAVLRTPRVLGLTLPYLMCDAMAPHQQQHQQQQCPLSNLHPILGEPAGWAARAGTPCCAADYHRHPHSSLRKSTPPYRSADLAARLLLEQLVPQRPGDGSIASQYSAFSATGGVSAGTVTSIGAARARAAAGGRGFRTSSVGSWCTGMEFDHVGGGAVRRTGGE